MGAAPRREILKQQTFIYFGHSDGSCSTDTETGSPTLSLPVTENGPAVSGSQSVTAVVDDGVAESQTGTGSVTGTGAVSSVGTNLKEMSFTSNGTYSVTRTQPAPACALHFAASVALNYQFVVTQPGFLDISLKNRGAGTYTEFYLEMVTPTTSPYDDSYGEGLQFDSSARVYLPAGTFEGYAMGQVGADDVVAATSGAGRSSIKATFSQIGSRTEAASGKGKRYVNLPATARDCATDTVTASITDKAKRAKLVKQVRFYVNGALKKKVKTPGRGEAVTLTGIADGEAADVRAVVKLVKKANGKKRNPAEVTSSHEACGPSS